MTLFINEFLSKVESPLIKQEEVLEDNTKPRNEEDEVEKSTIAAAAITALPSSPSPSLLLLCPPLPLPPLTVPPPISFSNFHRATIPAAVPASQPATRPQPLSLPLTHPHHLGRRSNSRRRSSAISATIDGGANSDSVALLPNSLSIPSSLLPPGSYATYTFLMSDKGKAIATASKKRKHSTPSIPSIYRNYAKNPLHDEDKENQQLPSTNPDKFPNLYSTSGERHSPRPPPPSLPPPSPFIAPSLPLTLPLCLYPFAAQRHSPRPPLPSAQVPPRCSGQFFLSPSPFLLPSVSQTTAPAVFTATVHGGAILGKPPPSAPEPTYLLVQRLFRFLERERLHVRRRLDRMDQALISLGAELPPLPESPTSDEQDHREEDADEPLQRDAPPAAPDTTEVPEPQPEPEPIIVPPTDPPV
ncbi:ras-associated and pleckstrin homology domains-containing protein 1-like [Arachis ipaensis]|uniref:ras-associated and pleckstrin homology domains-containing protein 1-like n=1 Tax=Arachis ipaensis TaxID=130454 RepID=UPI0007AF6985|nr:ras-associated and pleckstrin homology domains-containing protein 1-like [Arachis ipaensis]